MNRPRAEVREAKARALRLLLEDDVYHGGGRRRVPVWVVEALREDGIRIQTEGGVRGGDEIRFSYLLTDEARAKARNLLEELRHE